MRGPYEAASEMELRVQEMGEAGLCREVELGCSYNKDLRGPLGEL